MYGLAIFTTTVSNNTVAAHQREAANYRLASGANKERKARRYRSLFSLARQMVLPLAAPKPAAKAAEAGC